MRASDLLLSAAEQFAALPTFTSVFSNCLHGKSWFREVKMRDPQGNFTLQRNNINLNTIVTKVWDVYELTARYLTI
jgi:hypothetical protein